VAQFLPKGKDSFIAKFQNGSWKRKGPSQVIGKGPFQLTLIVSLLLARLYSFLPHMIFNRLNGHFFPVENACSQGSLDIRLLKDL
jgi:hypothetical protein